MVVSYYFINMQKDPVIGVKQIEGKIMKKSGRKPSVIDWEKVDNLLISGCQGTEVAAHFGVHAETLYRRCEKDKKVGFAAYSQQKRSSGNCLIRAAQFDEAVRKRDRGMLIWLGKNRLGQSDKAEVAHKREMPIQIVNYGDKPIAPWKDENSKSFN